MCGAIGNGCCGAWLGGEVELWAYASVLRANSELKSRCSIGDSIEIPRRL